MWNETLELQVEAMGRQNCEAVENLLGILLMRKVAGQELLCQLHHLEVVDISPNPHKSLVQMRGHLHLMSVVSLGLGIIEVWLLFLN
jgi:hypothetical protein